MRRDLLEWYRRLLQLRQEWVVPARDDREVQCDEKAGWLSLRVGEVWVACNFDHEPRHVPVPHGEWELALASIGSPATPMIDVPPAGTCIWRRVTPALG